MKAFMKGLQFNHLFYTEVVRPILLSHFPRLEYSAALIGWGSEVLGFDDAQSTDHNWGPRFQIFIAREEDEKNHDAIHNVLHRELPPDYLGQPVSFPIVGGEHQSTKADGTSHNIEVQTIKRYFSSYLGCDPYGEIVVADWLTFPEHKLLAVTSGEVFHDGLNELELIRQKFLYYPRDVWLYLLAGQWEKISEEQAFVGRCGHVGDELGSALIAAKQIKNLMRLCFLMERKYAPYSKWFGTAFNRLACADELNPIFMKVLRAPEWRTRQEFLAIAYEVVARMHNALQITIPLRETAAPYFGRPYLVIGDERYTEELRKLVTDEEVRKIDHNLGSVNQFIDSTDQINDLNIREKLKELYA